jgi:copper chaperone
MQTETMNVTGMTCGGCVSKVTKALTAVPGVGHVDVSLPGKASVNFDEKLTSRERLQSAGKDAGYGVAPAGRLPQVRLRAAAAADLLNDFAQGVIAIFRMYGLRGVGRRPRSVGWFLHLAQDRIGIAIGPCAFAARYDSGFVPSSKAAGGDEDGDNSDHEAVSSGLDVDGS